MSESTSETSNRRSRNPFRPRDSHRMVIAEDDVRRSYLRRTEQMIGIRYPAEYVDRAEILVMLNRNDRLCGGAMLVTDGPFRSIAGIPAEHRSAHDLLNLRDDVAEINGVWMAPEMKSPMLSISFWRLLIGHMIGSQKASFLFTFDNSNANMKLLSYWLSPTKLFSGTTLPLPGMKAASEETIALINIEPVKVFLALLERRGAGATKPDKAKVIARSAANSF